LVKLISPKGIGSLKLYTEKLKKIFFSSSYKKIFLPERTVNIKNIKIFIFLFGILKNTRKNDFILMFGGTYLKGKKFWKVGGGDL